MIIWTISYLAASLLSTHSVLAQDFSYQKALQDYKYTYSLYAQADSDYQLAKAQYINSKTLTAQTKAQQATYAFLRARDDVLRTYLSALRQKLAETNGLVDSDRNILYSRIDQEVSWYIDHRDKIPSAGSLDDLFSDSEKAREHYKATEGLMYRIFSTLTDAPLRNFHDRIDNIISAASNITLEIKQNKDKDTSTIERWIIETQNRIDRSKEKEISTYRSIPSIEQESSAFNASDKLPIYNGFLTRYDESLQYLKEATSFLREIVNKIKTVD
jgi:hypothetical protein